MEDTTISLNDLSHGDMIEFKLDDWIPCIGNRKVRKGIWIRAVVYYYNDQLIFLTYDDGWLIKDYPNFIGKNKNNYREIYNEISPDVACGYFPSLSFTDKIRLIKKGGALKYPEKQIVQSNLYYNGGYYN